MLFKLCMNMDENQSKDNVRNGEEDGVSGSIEEEEETNKEKEQALQLIKEIGEKNEKKINFRITNQQAPSKRPDESFFRKLDSSLKKNTSFVKKLGKLTEQQRTALTNEFQSLNLTRYMQEVVSTLIDAKLKMSDVSCAVQICSLVHQRYQDFTTQLFQAFKRVCQSRVEDKSLFVNQISKVRTDLRFIAEITVGGILTDKEGLTLIHNQLCAVLASDRDRLEILSLIISFCKHNGEDIAGLLPRKNRLLADKFGMEIPKSDIISPEKQKIFHNLLIDYWNSVRDHVVSMHKELRQTEYRNRQILQTKGELHEERSRVFAEKQAAYEKLQLNCNILADLLDTDVPDLPESEITHADHESSINICDQTGHSPDMFSEQSVWEDEDQKSFYTNMLDLKAIVPAILYKDSGPKHKNEHKSDRRRHDNTGTATKPMGPKLKGKGEIAAEEMDRDLTDLEIAELDQEELVAVQEAAEARIAVSPHEPSKDDNVESDDDGDKDALSLEDDTEEDDINIGTSTKILMDNFIASLKNCVNRELVDRASQDFCMNMNSKSNRKKLARALFNVHRSRLDLLPFYARLAATLYSCVPDVADHLTLMLLRDFRFHVRKKDQIHIESKVKTVRFIGEMTKFDMITTSDTLNCLKMLILEFSPHAIEMACALLETCGRFLLRNKASHLRARVLLEQLVRKRVAKAIDQRYATMIDNARYTCDPPKSDTVVYKPRPPIHEYIRKLLFRDLSKSTVEKVLRQMRKLPWSNPEVYNYILKCLGQSWSIKFNNVHCLASLVAGLVSYRDDVGHIVVDDVLEDIRVGMEINHPRYNQRRVSSVKFLGELYNYRMLESSVIFNVLYSFITFGVSYDPSRISLFDPPEHLLRIRLVCVLLETCGQYFDRGSSKRRLDYFIAYFQRYIWLKRSLPYWSLPVSSDDENSDSENTSRFPIEVDYLVQDTLEPLRPKLQFAASFQEAANSVAGVEKEMFAKIEKVVTSDKIHHQTVENLSTIPEGSSQVDHVEDENSSQSGSSDNEDKFDEEIDTGEMVTGEIDENDPDSEVYTTRSQVRRAHCVEDDDFQKALDAIMSESIQSRKQTVVVQHDMTVPVSVKKAMSKEQEADSMKFALLTKKGNKPTLRPLKIPVSEHFAAGLRDRTQAEERRKQELKQITLSINERQVEEEQNQFDTSYHTRQPPANLNRERRPKYQPPKGAPNADLIFSSGGRRR
uniref:Regulator of nonsense transcripts 2-like n=1 Tax=Phallusia mammillata TaxID=59560 RepID=A0A6F9DVS6_9ASCI|nr:regulator of nonsense transcripts 2-like [Phallusia mammillata]